MYLARLITSAWEYTWAFVSLRLAAFAGEHEHHHDPKAPAVCNLTNLMERLVLDLKYCHLTNKSTTKNNLLLLLLLISIFSLPALAQEKGPLQVELAPAGTFALYYGKPIFGYGGGLKFFFPARAGGRFLTTGICYDRLIEKSSYSDDKYHYSFLTAAVGYRKIKGSFFIEPQAGVGIYQEGKDYRSFAYFIGIEPGIGRKNLRLSLRYRLLMEEDPIFGEQFHVFSLKIGITIPLAD